MWAALGIAIMAVIMRVDYRVWRQPALIWAALGFAGTGAGRRPVQRAHQRHPPLVRHRRLRDPAVGGRQARRDLLHGGAARAAHEPGGRPARDAGAPGHRRGRDDRPDPARAGLRHLGVPGRHRGPHAVCRRVEPALRRRGGRHGPAGGCGAHRDLALSAEADPLVHVARGRPARRGVPAAAVADCRRQRRRVGPRADGRACRSCSTCPNRTPTSSTR